MSVIELKTRPVAISETVIARLEEMLEEAKSGKIISVAIAAVENDGSISSSWSGTDDFPRLLGSIARLQHRINIKTDSQ